MKTVKQLKALIESAGGTLEEDEGFSDTRVFQAVAPTGKLWKGDDLQCLVVYWARGTAKPVNDECYHDVAGRVSHGLRDMTPEERVAYDVDAAPEIEA